MSTAVIGVFFKTEKALREGMDDLHKKYARNEFYVVCSKNGYLVISESAAKKLRPDLFPKRKMPKINKKNYNNNIL